MPLPEEIVSQLPEEIRNDASLQSFNDVGGLAKSYLETKSMVGRSIQLPGKETKPEDLDKWAGETGARLKDHGYTVAKLSERPPASPDDYNFKFEGVSEEVIKNDKALNAFKANAHKLGLNNAQAIGLLDHFANDIVPALKESTPPKEFIEGDGLKAINEKAFGAEAETAIKEFRTAVKQLSAEIPNLPDVLNEGVVEMEGGKFVALGDHPAIVTLVREVAKLKAQDFSGGFGLLSEGDSLESIEAEIADIRNNKQNAMHERYFKNEDSAVAHMETLYKKKAAVVAMRKKAS